MMRSATLLERVKSGMISLISGNLTILHSDILFNYVVRVLHRGMVL